MEPERRGFQLEDLQVQSLGALALGRREWGWRIGANAGVSALGGRELAGWGLEVCRRVRSTPGCRGGRALQPLAPGRILYFSNSGRAGAGSSQPLPERRQLGARRSGEQSAGSGARTAGRSGPGPAPSAHPRAPQAGGRCWPCLSGGVWAW